MVFPLSKEVAMVLATHIQAACARLNFAASSAWESNHRQGVIRVTVIA
jgi:hypothetical protein